MSVFFRYIKGMNNHPGMTAVKYIVSYFPVPTVIEWGSYFLAKRLAYLEPADDGDGGRDKTIKKKAAPGK